MLEDETSTIRMRKMLSDREKQGCLRLLEKLTNEEILSLKNTITNRLVSAESRGEAVKAILEYSQSAVELLRRRKVRRDLLFQYLADCNVIAPVNAEKHELIRRVLEFWGSSVSPKQDLTDIDSTTALATAAPQESSPSVQQRLGETFAQWFYQLLNAENPTCNVAAGDDKFGPHHFWENCTLKLVTRTPDLTEDCYEGNVLTAQRLQALAQEEQLLFNPNISTNGVRAQSNPHGLVIVMVCGTVHQHNNCLGIFEQVFGLVSDPLNENKWKVKVTQLCLSTSRVTALPRLSDSSARELLSVAGSMSVALRS